MNYVIYDGPSLIGNQPIVVIASGIDTPSRNAKTGWMTQTWILRSDVPPGKALRNGADQSICGDCSLRGHKAKQGACYVNVDFAPRAIYQSYHSGQFVDATTAKQRIALGRDRLNRLGAYGDPGAVPINVWADLTQRQRGSTGYTHRWRSGDPELKRFCMASTESAAASEEAQELGYRTFRVKTPGQPRLKGEALCPASKEAGRWLTCAECRACDGRLRGLRGNVVVDAHGVPHKVRAFSGQIRTISGMRLGHGGPAC